MSFIRMGPGGKLMRRAAIGVAACMWPIAAARAATRDQAGVDLAPTGTTVVDDTASGGPVDPHAEVGHPSIRANARQGIANVESRGLEATELRLVTLEDSSSYFVYRYQAVQPAQSSQGAAAILLDVDAPPGTPSQSLPATGRFINGPAMTPLSFTPHVELGPISPKDWGATLRRTGVLVWSGRKGEIHDNDSIAPGRILSGLGIRSRYLPGIRTVGSVPTWQSCCREPWGTTEENPTRQHRSRDDFAVYAAAVGPTYAPEQVDVALLEEQIDAVCANLLWIDDSFLCVELADSLEAAKAREVVHDRPGALAAVEGFRDVVEANAQRMHSNAFYLLRANAGQVIANLEDASR